MTGTIRTQVGTFCEAPRPSVQGNQVRPGFSHGGVFRRMKDCKGLPGYLACFVRSCSENASNFKNLPNPAVGFTDLLGFLGIIFNQRCHLICLEMAWWIPGRLCWLDLQLKVGPEGFMVILYGAVSVFVLKRTMNSVFFLWKIYRLWIRFGLESQEVIICKVWREKMLPWWLGARCFCQAKWRKQDYCLGFTKCTEQEGP